MPLKLNLWKRQYCTVCSLLILPRNSCISMSTKSSFFLKFKTTIMRITIVNGFPGLIKKANLKIHVLAITLCCIAALFFSTIILAQTTPTVGVSKLVCTAGSAACPANGLPQVQDMFVEGAGQRLTCEPNSQITRTLYMNIYNSTGSTRTSFALFGNLNGGATLNGISGKIFICVGPINITKGLNTFAVGHLCLPAANR